MNTLRKFGLWPVVIVFGLIGAYLTRPLPTTPDKETIVIYKKQLYQIAFERALYRQIAIIGYSKIHHVSQEVAVKHLDEGVKRAEATKQFEDGYTNYIRGER